MVSYSRCSNCKVHYGFKAGWDLAKGFVNPQLQELRAIYKGAPIYITGHSLGGAFAVISAADIKETFGNIGDIYTFGEPRVGNK
jgi:triacylglycerol lipase